MVKVNLLPSSIAATTAFAALSHVNVNFNTPLHVQAFSPAATTRAHRFASTTSTRTHTRTQLASSVVDETAPSVSPDNASNDSNNSDAGADQVAAKAEPYKFIPSPNGKAGIMAIKLLEENMTLDFIAPIAVNAEVDIDGSGDGDTEEETIAPPTPEQPLQASSTGMFGGIASQAKIKAPKRTTNKSQQGEDFVGKAVVFQDGRVGTVIAQRPPMAFVTCDFGEWDSDSEGAAGTGTISILKQRSVVPVSNDLFGSIVDCYGHPIASDDAATATATDVDASDSKSEDDKKIERAIFAPIPKVSDIALINSPLLTGSAMVDALAPIGKGQNMLVIGQDTGVGQRELMIGAIKTQLNSKDGAKCIYAITSQKKEVRDQVIQQLKDAGVLDDIVVVSARDCVNEESEGVEATHSAEAITVAATACSIGEAFALAEGEDTFVVVDDIDQHKAFWDWTTRVLVEIFGVDSVVKDDKSGGASSEMRGFYSSLIQRAARFNVKNGGGSMTLSLLTNLEAQFGADDDDTVFSEEDFAESSEKVKQRIAILVNKKIPLTPETLRKISIPLPVASDSENRRRIAIQHTDDLISMSDGQIWLDESLYNNGQRPALDAQRSITRVGIGADTTSRADAPAMRNLVGGLRFDFAQADSLDGAGANSGADKQILKKKAYLLAMHQENGEQRALSENCVTLLAATMRVLDDTINEGGTAGTELGRDTITKLIDHVQKTAPTAMSDIDASLDLTDSTREELEKAIEEYFA
jgi:F0F1-type ATP synthase alpha subunit